MTWLSHRNVEPKAKAELGGGGAATTDRRCEAVALATKDEAIIFGRGEGAQHVKMKRGRKKAHWKVPALTRLGSPSHPPMGWLSV